MPDKAAKPAHGAPGSQLDPDIALNASAPLAAKNEAWLKSVFANAADGIITIGMALSQP